MLVATPSRLARRVHERVAPTGRRLALACLFGGYIAVALAYLAPDAVNAALAPVPDAIVLPAAYLVSFAYPAGYAMLALVAALGVVVEHAEGSEWSRRDHVHVYLAVAFGEWSLHHLLYLLFPLALLWAYLSLVMGVVYAIPAWGTLCVAAVGVIVGDRYRWYHDPDSLPEGAPRHG